MGNKKTKSAKLELERVKLADLKSHPKNPRRFPEPGSAEWEALRRSLAVDYFDPIIVNSGETHEALKNVLVSGHLRVKVLLADGYTHADAVVKDYSPERHVQVMLFANNQTGEWDETMLAELLKGIPETELDLTGFDNVEIDRLLAGLGGVVETPEPQIDRAEELRKKWDTKRGQLWENGEHRLLCGDSTKTEDAARICHGVTGFTVLTDPPFELPLKSLVASVFSESADAVLLMLSGHRVFEVEAASGWKLHNDFVINRPAFLIPNSHVPTRTHFYFLDFSKGGHSLFERGDEAFNSLRLWDWEGRETEHSFEKPCNGIVEMLAHYPASRIIFDPFSGSGTTICSCEQLKRKCRAIEIEPRFVAVTLERLSEIGLEPKLAKS